MGKGKGAGPGRPKGSKNKRTLEGESYSKEILVQDEADLVRDDSGHVMADKHPEALSNPVFRRLRAQAREGLGNKDGMLPPASFVQIADRAWGKVVDRVKLQTKAAKAYEGETDEDLAKRAADLAEAIGMSVDEDLRKPVKPEEAN
jgi:hypothetical protein